MRGIQEAIEANDAIMCFSIEVISEYRQIIGQVSGERQKSLTLFSQMKAMAECHDAGKEYFANGTSIGILVGDQRPMHPLITRNGSGIEFFKESLGQEALMEKIEIFLAMGSLSVEAPEIKIGGPDKKSISGAGNVIDTQSKQFIERLGIDENDPEKRTKRDDRTYFVEREYKERKGVDLFARKLVNAKNPSIDRRVDQYLSDGQASNYTEAALKKDPDPIEYLEAQEDIYFPPESGLMKYFPLFSEMIGKEHLNKEVMQKLARLVLEKSFNCALDFFTVTDKTVIPETQGMELTEELQKVDGWNLNEPHWEDETFASTLNRFIMPFYHNGECNGFARVEIKGEDLNHSKSAAIEAILSSCKGAYKQ